MNKRQYGPGIVALLLAAALPLGAASVYKRSEAMVVMRDGVRLHTVIYVPETADGPLPFILNRTPYGAGGDEKGHPKLAMSYKELADEGYIFVFQDIRGRYGSEGGFVMMRPPRDREAPQSGRRGDRRLRYDRLARPQRPRQQRSRRHARRLLRRLAHGPGPDRSASGPQSRLSPGLAGRHVHGGRFLPRRRFPAELRLRVRGPDGDVQHRLSFPLRRLRYLRVVPEAGPPGEHRREVSAREDPDLERFRRSSRLRRLLEEAGGDATSRPGLGPDAQRRGLVGPGGLLRAPQDLRGARGTRHRPR